MLQGYRTSFFSWFPANRDAYSHFPLRFQNISRNSIQFQITNIKIYKIYVMLYKEIIRVLSNKPTFNRLPSRLLVTSRIFCKQCCWVFGENDSLHRNFRNALKNLRILQLFVMYALRVLQGWIKDDSRILAVGFIDASRILQVGFKYASRMPINLDFIWSNGEKKITQKSDLIMKCCQENCNRYSWIYSYIKYKLVYILSRHISTISCLSAIKVCIKRGQCRGCSAHCLWLSGLELSW